MSPESRLVYSTDGNNTCDECKSEFFEEVICIRKISRLLSGQADDSLVPMKTYRCAECKHINKDFKLDK